MSLIHWMPENNIKVDFIDDQHRQLATLINQLEVALEENGNTSGAIKILRQIYAYASSHFAREENLMEMHRVPDLEIHRNEHFFFEDTVALIEDAVNDGNQFLAHEKLIFLAEWFIDHIRETDREYLQYVVSEIKVPPVVKADTFYRGQLVKSEDSSSMKKHATLYRGQKIAGEDAAVITKTTTSSKSVYRGQRNK